MHCNVLILLDAVKNDATLTHVIVPYSIMTDLRKDEFHLYLECNKWARNGRTLDLNARLWSHVLERANDYKRTPGSPPDLLFYLVQGRPEWFQQLTEHQEPLNDE